MSSRSESTIAEPSTPKIVKVSEYGLVLRDQRWRVEVPGSVATGGLTPVAFCTVNDNAHFHCNFVIEELERDGATGDLFFYPPNPSKYFVYTHIPPMNALHARVSFRWLGVNEVYIPLCPSAITNFVYHFRTQSHFLPKTSRK